MKVSERIIDGIKRGVDRHWRYTKNLLRIKPEYLLTVSVADALTDGFDNIHGLDLEIKLEEPTHAICADLLIKSVGLRDYFKTPKIRGVRSHIAQHSELGYPAVRRSRQGIRAWLDHYDLSLRARCIT